MTDTWTEPRLRDLNLDAPSHAALLEGLRTHARNTHADFPQYDGKFDDWTLRIVTQDTQFKGSSYVPRGRIVLAAPEPYLRPGDPVSWAVYCTDTGFVCALPYEDSLPLTPEGS